MNRITAAFLLATISGSALAQPPAPTGPSQESAKYPLDPPTVTTKAKFKIETVAENLEVPWGIAFLPGDRVLFTERPGRVRMIEKGTLNPVAVFTPDVSAVGERGLMGICIHPDFATNHWVYLAYGSKEKDIRVVRYTLKPPAPKEGSPANDPGGLADPLVIVKGLPFGINHAGCRIRFGPDKKLYVTAGEMFKKELAADLTSLGGKILRLNDDGSIPADNPFTGEEFKARGERGEIWALGVRNPQGIDWDPATGLLWETEHGPSGERGVSPGMGGDELNIIEKGKDYGWPTIHHGMKKPGLETPVMEWTPAIAPASGAFYPANGAMFPEWKGSYFFGALGGLRTTPQPGVVRCVVSGRMVTGVEWLAKDYGRIREVAVAPDGSVWFSTSNKDGRSMSPAKNDDRIMRIVAE